MTINLSAINNISNFNGTLAIHNNDILSTLYSTPSSAVGDIFAYVILFAILVYLYYTFSRRNGIFGYDVSRSFALSSGITLVISIILTLVNFIQVFKAIVILSFIFIIAIFATYKVKQNRG